MPRWLMLFFALGWPLLGGATSPPAPVQVTVLAINDFHGYLKPPPGGFARRDPADPEKRLSIPAGGAEYLASAVDALKGGNSNTIFVAAGDLVGASPMLSSLFLDEPTVESLSAMGLAASAVGNHEFDKGLDHLLRLQLGGCAGEGSCQGPQPFRGAGFQYLAASTVDRKSGELVLPPYLIRRFAGIPVAFIGLTLQGTPDLVAPAGVAGLAFRDEADTVNALVPQLRAQGVEAIVVLIHEGGWPEGGENDCPGISGPIVDIVRRLDPAVDLVISGHTHQAYTCRIDGRLVTSGDKFGTLLTRIDLWLDPATGDVLNAIARNHVVSHADYAPHPAQTALIAHYEAKLGPLAGRTVGTLAAPLAREPAANGESPLGQVVADAQLAATRGAGAQIALTNPGGIRNALLPDVAGRVRYEDVYAVQPFANQLVTLTLSGAQLQLLLEQQWLEQPRPRILQVSQGFGYTWDAAQPPGQRVVAGSLQLDGQPIAPTQRLRVTVNSYLADGGDKFSVLTGAGEREVGVMDVEALAAYLSKLPAGNLPNEARIRRLN